MNTKTLLIAPLAVLLLGLGGAGQAAEQSSGANGTPASTSGMMQAEAQNGNSPGMGHMMRHGMRQGGMMGNSGMMGMGNSGMMGMMGACPMMGMVNGPNGKVMMQMHGEMMRAMGDIMIKYADKLEVPAAPR